MTFISDIRAIRTSSYYVFSTNSTLNRRGCYVSNVRFQCSPKIAFGRAKQLTKEKTFYAYFIRRRTVAGYTASGRYTFTFIKRPWYPTYVHTRIPRATPPVFRTTLPIDVAKFGSSPFSRIDSRDGRRPCRVDRGGIWRVDSRSSNSLIPIGNKGPSR